MHAIIMVMVNYLCWSACNMSLLRKLYSYECSPYSVHDPTSLHDQTVADIFIFRFYVIAYTCKPKASHLYESEAMQLLQ